MPANELFTPEAFVAEMDTLMSHYSEIRVIGSVGRTALFSRYKDDPEYEFKLRGQPPLGDSLAPRDIDVIGLPPPPTRLIPFKVDVSHCSNSRLQIALEGASPWLVSTHHQFAEELHPDVMAPIEASGLFGATIVTPPPQTNLVLFGMRGEIRKKDGLAYGLLEEVCETLPSNQKLPAKLFAPFEKLRAMNDADLYIRLQNVYRKYMPESAKRKLAPLLNRVDSRL